jgi:hypothetical protein
MTQTQTYGVFLYLLLAVVALIQSVMRVRQNQSYSLATPFQFLGIYVWGDALLIAPYWLGTSLISLFLNDWLFFLLTISLFWVVRGFGETIYWLNQQFSPILREPPEKFWHYQFVKDDSVWFMYQVFSQIITITALLVTLLLLKQWFSNP